MEKGESWLAFMAGLLLGGLVGAVVALLYAPQSGTETRRQIQEKGIELQEQLDASMARARKRYDEFVVEVQAEIEKLGAALESKKQATAAPQEPEGEG